MKLPEPITTVVYGPYVGFVSLDCFRAITNLAEGTKLYSEEQMLTAMREAQAYGEGCKNAAFISAKARAQVAALGPMPASMKQAYFASLSGSKVEAAPATASVDVDKALFLICKALNALNRQIGGAQHNFVRDQCNKLLSELKK